VSDTSTTEVPDNDDVWLTTAQVARRAQRHPATVRAHASAKTLKSTNPGRGRGRRYHRDWVDEWIQTTPVLPAKAAS
jgi:hypothetical protein